MNMKKTPRYAILCFLMMMLLSACMRRETAHVRNLEFDPVNLEKIDNGIYEGRFTYADFEYVVEIDVEDHKIRDIKVLQNRSSKYALMAEDVLPRVLEAQNLNVDATTGATTTSKALLKAIENALTNTKQTVREP
jgi:uncharacterized protein with FMN-binding domain